MDDQLFDEGSYGHGLFEPASLSRGPRWHLGREISITLIISVTLQTCALIWYVSKLDSRVHILEDERIEHVETLAKLVEDRDATHSRLTALEIKSDAVLDGVRRIEAHLYGGANNR